MIFSAHPRQMPSWANDLALSNQLSFLLLRGYL